MILDPKTGKKSTTIFSNRASTVASMLGVGMGVFSGVGAAVGAEVGTIAGVTDPWAGVV